MELQSVVENIGSSNYLPVLSRNDQILSSPGNAPAFKNDYQYYGPPGLRDFLTRLDSPAGKKSFLVFKNNRYFNIRTEDIALFYVKYESTIIVTFNKQEFFIDHSLEQLQRLLSEKQFFRLNRQYLVNFDAIKEAEHYFARKLLVNAVIPTKEKLIVSKEKVTSFLQWMDNR